MGQERELAQLKMGSPSKADKEDAMIMMKRLERQ